MSARNYGIEALLNLRRSVNYKFSVTSLTGAAAAPTFIEGDGFSGANVVQNTSTGTYITVSRTGVGVYVFTTNDPFPGFVSCGFQLAASAPAGQLTITAAPAVQAANNTWSLTISCFNGAAARELAAGDYIYCDLTFRNGTNTP